MEVSIFLAKVIGLYMLIMGIVMIVRRKWLQTVLAEMFDSKPIMLIGSMMALILGILLVVAHPAFTPDWCSVISAIAWLTLIKGIVYLFMPQRFLPLKRQMLDYVQVYYVSGIIMLLLGLFLMYHVFYIV